MLDAQFEKITVQDVLTEAGEYDREEEGHRLYLHIDFQQYGRLKKVTVHGALASKVDAALQSQSECVFHLAKSRQGDPDLYLFGISLEPGKTFVQDVDDPAIDKAIKIMRYAKNLPLIRGLFYVVAGLPFCLIIVGFRIVAAGLEECYLGLKHRKFIALQESRVLFMRQCCRAMTGLIRL